LNTVSAHRSAADKLSM